MRAAPSEKPSPEKAEKIRRAASVQAAALGEPSEIGRWDFGARATFPIVAIHAALLPTGKVMFFSYPQVPEWKNSAEAYLWDPVTNDITRKDPPLWLDPKDGVEKPGQHLVRRAHVHGRRRAGGLRREPRLRERAHRLEGTQQGLHVQPVDGDLEGAAGHGARPLVSHRRPDGRRPHSDHERAGRDRSQHDGRGHRDLHAGVRRSTAPARSAWSARRARASRGCRRRAAITRTCSPCPRATPSSSDRSSTRPGC